METPILDMLTGAARGTAIRFCMPGHKGKGAFLAGEIDTLDITELPGVDNLYAPEGAILRSQRQYAAHVGAKSAHYLVNGSTCGVETSILSALSPGDKVLVARDLHLSALSALILADVKPIFINPQPTAEPLPGVVTPEQVERAIRRHTDAKAVYVTYPNYYGQCIDLDTIAAMAHEAHMLLICDAAHAAAFDFSNHLPASPGACGCDLWTVSLHKTLPAMNQCAAMFIGKGCKTVSSNLVQSRLNWMQTTSPSYLLLGSSEYAVALMMEEGDRLLSKTVDLVKDATRRIESLGGYKVLTKSTAFGTGAYDRDMLRMVIDVTDRGLTGLGAQRDLIRRGIAVEGADLSNIILVCSVADSKDDYDKLINALQSIKGGIYSIEQTITNQDIRVLYDSEFEVPIRQAALAPRETVPLAECEGRIAASPAGLYPPGVPIIMPGQRLKLQTIRILERLRKSGYSTFGISDTIDVAKTEPTKGYNVRSIS